MSVLNTAQQAAQTGSPVLYDANTNAYMITITRNTVLAQIDYVKLAEKRVLGLLIEAGALYNSAHIETTFRNPQLSLQVSYALDNGIPYAFYMCARARSEQEVKRELKELSFIIKTYAPVLGVWLKLEAPNSLITNDKLLDLYADELIKLGLKGNIGIYVTQDQLQSITWSKHQDTWYLWLIEHIPDYPF